MSVLNKNGGKVMTINAVWEIKLRLEIIESHAIQSLRWLLLVRNVSPNTYKTHSQVLELTPGP